MKRDEVSGADGKREDVSACTACESWTWRYYINYPHLCCSRCGESMPHEIILEQERMESFTIPKYPYCPHCGAKVVDAGLDLWEGSLDKREPVEYDRVVESHDEVEEIFHSVTG